MSNGLITSEQFARAMAHYRGDPAGWRAFRSRLRTETRCCARCLATFETVVSDREFCSQACSDAAAVPTGWGRRPPPPTERDRESVRAYDACQATDAAGVVAEQFGIGRDEVVRAVRVSLMRDDDEG